MITTAAQAFTFCSGSLASRTDLPEAQRYSNVFASLANLCGDIPCELPGPDVVAFALITVGQGEDGYQAVWRGLGFKLSERLGGSPIKAIASGATPEQVAELVDKMREQSGQVLLAPGAKIEFMEVPDRLPEAIWLWQMLIHACECRIASLPNILQNDKGQLAIERGSLLQPISLLDAQDIQRQRQAMAVLAAGLRGELRMLIQQLCPQRTEAINKAIEEQRAKADAAQKEQEQQAQAEPPRLTIVSN